MIARPVSRRGASMVVVVLTCLLVSSALVRAMTLATIRARRMAGTELQLLQTELLLDAGILRAARQLQNDPAYQGETWQPRTELEQFGQGRVEIRVRPAEETQTQLVEVTAYLGGAPAAQPGSDPTLTRRSHTFQIESNQE